MRAGADTILPDPISHWLCEHSLVGVEPARLVALRVTAGTHRQSMVPIHAEKCSYTLAKPHLLFRSNG